MFALVNIVKKKLQRKVKNRILIDTKGDSADSLEKAIERVKAAYNAQEIILDAEDLVPDYTTGESASFCEADWIDPDEIQKKDVDFTL